MKPVPIALRSESWNDKDTGRRVTRLCPVGVTGSHAYFTSTSCDGEGRLILSCQCRDKMQLCRVDLSSGKAWQLTDFDHLRAQGYCVSPVADCALAGDGDKMVRVDLTSGDEMVVFTAPPGWYFGTPTVDGTGTRAAFSLSERAPGFTRTERIYSTMPENFFFRPRSLVCCLDLASNSLSVAWGETEWISHVLINPADPDIIVFCHEGGSLAQHRLWVVDTRHQRKRLARCLYQETFPEFLVHEYFLSDGTLGVQRSSYDADAPLDVSGPYPHNYITFLGMDGCVKANYVLPGLRSGHVQSNSDNSLIVADCCYTGDPEGDKDGNKYLALNIPDGNKLRVEKLCRHDTSWKTQLSHPHPIFSPDDRHVVFSSDAGGSNSAFIVEV